MRSTLSLIAALAVCLCPPLALAQQPTDAVTPVAAQLPDVVARVNGEAISKGDLDKAVKELEANAGNPVPAEQRDRVLRSVLDQLIGYRLLIQETRARKTAVADADLDARIAEIQKQFPTEEAFRQVLEQRDMTAQQLRDDVRDDLMVSKMLEVEVEPRVSVNAGQVAVFYQQNPSQFQQGERVRASHILIRLPDSADAATKDQARAKAAGVLTQVKAGQDFAALAKQYSEDPGSAVRGGDLGYFEHGQMVGPFDQAAFAMNAGEVSELVETRFGYHIIKVADKQASHTVPLDDVRPQIEQYLEDQSRQAQTRAFVDTLRAKGQVEIFI